MNKLKTINGYQKKGGYTLLFAVLTASLVLGVAVFILSVSRKQFILSSTARESTFSIYAADSGIECAAAAIAANAIASTTGGTIVCAGRSDIPALASFNTNTVSLPSFASAVQSAYVPIKLNYGCVLLRFTTGTLTPAAGGTQATIVEARGYNQCTGTGSSLSPDTSPNSRTVERALQLTYNGIGI